MWFKISGKTVDFTAPVRYTNTLDALEITVQSIMENYKPPYRVMVTGGVDSQTVLLAWKWFGKDYIPTCVTYNGDYNRHDLVTLDKFATRENISVEYIDFDLFSFYESRYFELADIYKIASPHFGAHIGMTENLDGTVIFSGDRLPKKGGAIAVPNVCLYNASINRSMVPYFLIQTPELAYSKLHTLSKLSSEYQLIQDQYLTKVEILQREGLPVIPQDNKYTGFERVKEFYDQYHSKIPKSVKLKYASRPSKRAYDLLFRYPLEEKYGYSKFKYLINRL